MKKAVMLLCSALLVSVFAGCIWYQGGGHHGDYGDDRGDYGEDHHGRSDRDDHGRDHYKAR